MLTQYEAVAKRKELVKEVSKLQEEYDSLGVLLNRVNNTKKTCKNKNEPLESGLEVTKQEAKDRRSTLRSAIRKKNEEIERLDIEFKYGIGPLSMYEEDNMYMSYRYCVGRKSIGAHHHAGDIAKYCYGRMSDERSVFTAYDINREIERCMSFGTAGPLFYFPVTSYNRIYKTAVDIWCEFVTDNNIKTKEELLKYYSVSVELNPPYNQLSDNGYSVNVETWDEHIEKELSRLCEKHNLDVANLPTKEELIAKYEGFKEYFKEIDYRQKPENFYLFDMESLFAWNDLCHLFDIEHHETVRVEYGGKEEVVETFMTWTEAYETDKDGNRVEVAYRKIRVPINEWNPVTTVWIPEEYVNEIISTGKTVW